MDYVNLIVGAFVGSAITVAAVALAQCVLRRRNRGSSGTSVYELIRKHFRRKSLEQIAISERRFPYRVRADLQREIDRIFGETTSVLNFCGVRRDYVHEGLELSGCMVESPHNPMLTVPPQYEEVDVGEDEPMRCLKNGLWLLEEEGERYVVLLAPVVHFGQTSGVQFQIGTTNSERGNRLCQKFFRRLEEAVQTSATYRGKILSLELSEHSFAGTATGIMVHKLHTVERDQVILPDKTLQLLERNVIHFVRQRAEMTRLGLATKKGLLFYGPPGTGKTHTIHYLAKALSDHTTLLITADQVGLLGDYMTLARLLQPSIVVIEDVDLIARERSEMGSVCEEVMLNKLLNEMDGLKEQVDILFLLTTNRPETLERALASRPGRVDQAIEFPLPDDAGREKLVRLYSRGMEVSESVVTEIVKRTDRVSAAFIKELMRRSLQFYLERNGTGSLELQDAESALNEMLFQSGSLNLKLLGAEGTTVHGFSDVG